MCEAMGKPSLVVQIDEALCEEEQYLRPRMMGTHKRSVPAADRTAVSPTCDAPRGVCQPVLLRPGDLLSIHRKLDLNYRGSVCMVEHDPRTGVELNAVTKRPQSADERARLIVDGITSLVPVGSTTVLVTHGAFARRLGALLLGKNRPNEWAEFGYAEVAELCCTGEECRSGMWHVAGERYAPMGAAAGRGRHA